MRGRGRQAMKGKYYAKLLTSKLRSVYARVQTRSFVRPSTCPFTAYSTAKLIDKIVCEIESTVLKGY